MFALFVLFVTRLVVFVFLVFGGPFFLVAFGKHRVFDIGAERHGQQNFGAGVNEAGSNVFVFGRVECPTADKKDVVAFLVKYGIRIVEKPFGQLAT